MYKLIGRGTRHYLKKLKPNDENCKSFTLECQYCLRAGLTSEGNLFVDPSGGPFITKGTELDNIGTISKVDSVEGKGFVITFD